MRECFSLNVQNIKNSNIDWGYSMDICHINESSVKKKTLQNNISSEMPFNGYPFHCSKIARFF